MLKQSLLMLGLLGVLSGVAAAADAVSEHVAKVGLGVKF
ncbi:hypothetical protein J2768_003329 [Agrobacterium tumefaciens]|nr:hypothetical protein [Agrobacterium tumefaciens]